MACRMVSSITAEVGVTGSIKGQRLRARLIAGLAAPASARLEAFAFSQQVFILAARGNDATLLLPRDGRALEHGQPGEVLEAVTGLPLDASGLRLTLTGCATSGASGASGRQIGDDWRVVSDHAADLYLRRDARTAPWRLVAAVHREAGRPEWRAEYRDFENGLPHTIRLASTDSRRFDLRLALSQVEINVPIAAGRIRGEDPAGNPAHHDRGAPGRRSSVRCALVSCRTRDTSVALPTMVAAPRPRRRADARARRRSAGKAMPGDAPAVRVRAFAKINLALRVVGVRADGYHELLTTFQSLALHDTLTFTRARGPFQIACDDPACPVDRTNLVWRAADAIWRAAGRRGEPRGVRVRIEKRIPLAAGLGGGSSDAAASLRALPSLWGVELDEDRLRRHCGRARRRRAVFSPGRHGAWRRARRRAVPVDRLARVLDRPAPSRFRGEHRRRIPMVRSTTRTIERGGAAWKRPRGAGRRPAPGNRCARRGIARWRGRHMGRCRGAGRPCSACSAIGSRPSRRPAG